MGEVKKPSSRQVPVENQVPDVHIEFPVVLLDVKAIPDVGLLVGHLDEDLELAVVGCDAGLDEECFVRSCLLLYDALKQNV